VNSIVFSPKGKGKNFPDFSIKEIFWKKIPRLLKPDFPPSLFPQNLAEPTGDWRFFWVVAANFFPDDSRHERES
jgi:hypothetical protein